MNPSRNPSAPLPTDLLADGGVAKEVLDALDDARRKAIRYGALDILVVLKCPDEVEVSYAVGSGASFAKELRRVADFLSPMDDIGIRAETRRRLVVALREALKALEGA